jgi:hypothetical protein
MEQARFYDMPGINVWVAPVEPEIAEDGLDREQIRREMEKRLYGAGLPVIEKFDVRQAPEFPCLGVVSYVFQPQEDSPVSIFSIEMFFIQRITLAGPPATDVMRMAWCRGRPLARSPGLLRASIGPTSIRPWSPWWIASLWSVSTQKPLLVNSKKTTSFAHLKNLSSDFTYPVHIDTLSS